MMSNIQEKVVIITGASSGIGEATAKLLAQEGARVVLAARRTERLEKIVADIQQQGSRAVYKAVNVSHLSEMQALMEFALSQFGQIAVIFNNAGVMPLSPISALKVEEWNTMIDVNIRGVLNGIAAGLPIMEKQGKGHFINTASIGAHMVVPTGAVYCATKYAVWALSEGLRQESKNIRVTTISPGVVETELGSDITDDATKEVLKDLRKTALHPEAIARAVLYAMSQPDDVDVNEIIVRPTASAF
jgi:NADP-dependent 3-hydroxy acid dehydrogenase YdfG